MRLLKVHSYTSNGLAMKPGKREEKQLEETQTPQKGRPPQKNLSRTASMAGGAEKALWQTNHRKGTMPRQTLIERNGNTGVNTREKSCQNLPRTTGMVGGKMRKQKHPEWKLAPTAPKEEEVFSRKRRTNITQKNTKNKITHIPL